MQSRRLFLHLQRIQIRRFIRSHRRRFARVPSTAAGLSLLQGEATVFTCGVDPGPWSISDDKVVVLLVSC